MNDPKQRRSLLLPMLSLFALVPMRLVLEMITRGHPTPPAPEPHAPPPATTLPEDDLGQKPRAAVTSTREQLIAERAFQIWLDEGKPYGRDAEHWKKAEAEIDK